MTIVHGALQAFLAVVMGAFGAHGLEKVLDEYGLKIWHTAAAYHLSHALALVLLGICERQFQSRLPVSHWGFGLGIFFFSGSLYLLALTGTKWLGAITPMGGLLFIVGWLSLAWSAWKFR
ncbi:MAG: DUF423 domain-containing protein [Bacteriovoracia bacterium]